MQAPIIIKNIIQKEINITFNTNPDLSNLIHKIIKDSASISTANSNPIGLWFRITRAYSTANKLEREKKVIIKSGLLSYGTKVTDF